MSSARRMQDLEEEWKTLCEQYLPMAPTDSVWRYSQHASSNESKQGWKLHVSATILAASQVFSRVAPYLATRGTLFKAPRSIQELST